MPPLRDRQGDIRELAEAFLHRFAEEEGKTFGPLGAAQLAVLEQQSWPGNVRELQNVMRRAVVLNMGPDIPVSSLHFGTSALPASVGSPRPFAAIAGSPHPVGQGPATHEEAPCDPQRLVRAFEGLTLDEIERVVIMAAIDKGGGSLSAAAKTLGVSPSTLYRKRERWQKSG